MKKLFILVFMLTFSLMMFPKPNKAQEGKPPITTQPLGDYDGSGTVDQSDAVMMINMFYGGYAVNSGPFVDLYSDNEFTMEDIVIEIGFIQGRVPTLPVFPCTEFNTPYVGPYMTPVISLNGLPWVALPCFSINE